MGALQHQIEFDLLSRLSTASRGSGANYVATAREALIRLLNHPGLLDQRDLRRNAGGLARNLLFGNDDVSIWAMVWGGGATTPIHDHHCSCCFGVLTGSITERRFQSLDDERAAIVEEVTRTSGYVGCMLPSGPNIHQMLNDTDAEAISLHIYGYDHTAHASSIERVYRQVHV